MSNSLALLALPHDEAVRTIIQEALKPGVSVDDLQAGQYQVLPDGRVRQPVYIDSDAYSDPQWPYRGSVEMTIKRVDLQDALGHLGLKFRVATGGFPTSHIVGRIGSALELYFDPIDFVEDIHRFTTAGQMITIKAAGDSPRWKGQVDVFVYR